MSAFSDPIELAVGDLCVYEGDPKFCSLQQRIVYRVTKKVPTQTAWDPNAWTSRWAFTFEVAFDLFPVSAKDERYIHHASGEKVTLTKHGTRGLRRLDILALALVRNGLDNFLRQWAHDTEDNGVPGPENG